MSFSTESDPLTTPETRHRRVALVSCPLYIAIQLAIIALVGLILRCYQLGARSVWFDEAFCWRLIQFPFLEMIQRVGGDNHPPLYFVLLRGWATVFGESPISLRSLSVLFGMLTIVGTYMLAVEAFGKVSLTAPDEASLTRGRVIGLLAAAFAAVSAFQCRYSQEARMYSLAGMLAVFSSWALLRSLQPPSRLDRWLLYGILALSLAYTHYYALFTLAAQAIFVSGFLLVRGQWNLRSVCWGAMFWHVVLTIGFIMICWLPWLPILLEQRAQVQDAYWTSPVNLWNIAYISYQLFIPQAEGDNVPVPRSKQLLVADLCILGLWLLRRRARAGEWFILSAIMLPPLLAFLVSVFDTRVIGAPRFFLIVHLFLLIGLACLIWNLPLLERTITVVTMLMIFSWLCFDFWNTADIAHKPGARAAAEYIDIRRQPGEPVIVGSPLFFFSAIYHAEQRTDHYIYSDGSHILHYLGRSALISDDLITHQQLRTFSNRRIWFVGMTGSTWLGWHTGVIPDGLTEKDRVAFPEAFGLGYVIVAECETKRP